MKTKRMTVHYGTGTLDMTIPKIILQGKWLRELGYSVGDQIIVTYAEGQNITIQAVDNEKDNNMETEAGVCVQ